MGGCVDGWLRDLALMSFIRFVIVARTHQAPLNLHLRLSPSHRYTHTHIHTYTHSLTHSMAAQSASALPPAAAATPAPHMVSFTQLDIETERYRSELHDFLGSMQDFEPAVRSCRRRLHSTPLHG